MGLETGIYIDSLVVTNPTPGDMKSQGDDHIRLVKSTIRNSFPEVSGQVTLDHSQLSGVSTPLTGTPTAPTPVLGDNSSKIATTAYVDSTKNAEAYPSISGETGKFLTNDGTETSWGTPEPSIPPGVIIPFIGGYFGTASNGSFTSPHNTAAAINTLLNTEYRLYVANGAEVNIPGSVYYDGAGRFLANLTDDVFFMGRSAGAGISGGINETPAHDHEVDDHTHTIDSHTHTLPGHVLTVLGHAITINEMPSHSHTYSDRDDTSVARDTGGGTVVADDGLHFTARATSSVGSGSAHTHGLADIAAGTSGGRALTSNLGGPGGTSLLAATDNKPRFLTCWYLQKV